MLKELVEKNPDLISVDENDMLIYSFSDTVQNDPFGGVIRLRPEPTEFSLGVGVFALTPPDADFMANVGEYLGLQAGYEGPSTGVAPVTISGAIPRVKTINYMVVESGWLSLAFINESGVPVELPNGVTIINSDDGAVVGHLNYPGVIDPDDSVEVSIALAQTRIHHKLEYEFIFSSPPDDNVSIPDESMLAFRLHFEELHVSEADAQIPRQTLSSYYDGTIVIDDSTYISEALFSEGVLEIIIENMVDIEAPVTITFPALRARNNLSQHYSITSTLSPGAVDNFSVDMQNWKIHNNELKNSLNYTVRLGAIDDTGDYRTLRSTDMISGQLQAQDSPNDVFVVKWMEGIIPPTRYEIALRFELEIGEIADIFEGDVQFDNVQLDLGLFLSGGFDALADLTIIGMNKNGVRDSLIIPADRRRITAGEWSTIDFTKLNSRVTDFFNTFAPQFPDEVYISSYILINRDYKNGYIDVNDMLTASVQLDVPFQFGIRNGVVRDTLSVGDGDGELDRALFDYFNYGRMYFETENGIPVEMDLRINLLDSNGVVLRQLPIAGEPSIGIEAAPVNSSGYATGTSGRNVRVLELSREDIHILRETEMTELMLHINSSSESEAVVFRSRDSIRVNIFATFNAKAGFN